jgi:cytochrome c biogenesis protein CcmG/thiol:disulfide interchange protein DsbE
MDLSRRRLLMLAPLAASGVIGIAFWKMLDRMAAGKFDPHAIDNPLVGKAVPAFDLPGIAGAQGYATAQLREAAAQKPVLVNFFASWCIPCAQEAEMLGSIAAEGIPVWGIAYKDTPENAAKFLDRYGNPYRKIADDHAGMVGIDWGIDGVPESFLIDRTGIVRWHIGGPLTADNVRDDLRPALRTVA